MVLIIIWMLVIFIFSSMPGEESNNKSMGTINNAIEKTIEVTNHSGITNKHPSEDKKEKIIELLNKPLRKCMHSSVYFVLSILIGYEMYLFKFSIKKLALISIICCFIYACTDELHQLFVQGRSGQFSDVLIDTFGAIIGCICIYCFICLRSKIKFGKFEK